MKLQLWACQLLPAGQPQCKTVAGSGQRIVSSQHGGGFAEGVQPCGHLNAAVAASIALRGVWAAATARQKVRQQLLSPVQRLLVKVCEAADQRAPPAAAAPAVAANGCAAGGEVASIAAAAPGAAAADPA